MLLFCPQNEAFKAEYDSFFLSFSYQISNLTWSDPTAFHLLELSIEFPEFDYH